MSVDHKDQVMVKLPESPNHAKNNTQARAERRPKKDFTPKAKLCFGLPRLANPQALALEASANPFASLGKGNQGAKIINKLQEDATNGWSFQR